MNATLPERSRTLRPYPWEREQGCEADAPAPVGYLNAEPMMRCPLSMVPTWCWSVLGLFPDWERGNLPSTGGVLDQPAPVVDAMRCIAQERDAAHELKRKRDGATSAASAPSAGSAGGWKAMAPVKNSIRKR